ncbi:MAG: crossover junction endodeoxyribonuclease RuvC [Synergistaceae bacterium]|jgi:crossover junction endodeoxyribonuclease RuvC|nr:crossover junction endodeoxyribonuclease RuvC [Synergistaceae bacterium]
MLCLGIDPGIGRLGYGIVSQTGNTMRSLDYGVISTGPGVPVALRLKDIFLGIEEKISSHNPDVIAVERLYFGRNTTTAEMVWQARGVILLAAARFGLVPYEPKPSEIKLAVCGSGSADKRQVQGMVRNLLNLPETPKPDDAADALAAAITGMALSMYDTRNSMGVVQ